MPPPSFVEFDSQYLSPNRPKPDSLFPKSQHYYQRQQYNESSSNSNNNAASTSISSPSTSTPTSRTTTSSSIHSHHPSGTQGITSIKEVALRAAGLTPSPDIAEWAHQTHQVQRRSYWWCQGCFPKDVSEALEVPKAITGAGGELTGRRKRVVQIQSQPGHCYDI